MKHINLTRIVLLSSALVVAAIPSTLRASPYASGCTNIGGTVYFYLNESGGNVTVTYEDGTTNASFNGITTGTNLPVGKQSFSLGTNTSYAIQVYKVGSGTPSQISVDTNVPFCYWPSPRGVAVNHNPQNGRLFGRVYVDNSTPGTNGVIFNGIGNNKGRGIYALNSDLSDGTGKGTNASGTGAFIVNASSPWRMRVAPDNTVLVGDNTSANASLWQFSPDLTSSNLVLAIVGASAAETAGIHGTMWGTAKLTGSLASGNLTLWVGDSGLAVGQGGSSPTLGPGTSSGAYNCVYRYDIGSGPLPWNHPPNYAFSTGLSGIGNLNQTEVDTGVDGKIIAGFARQNLSNPNVQILDPTGATLLWTSWIDTGGSTDPWSGLINGFDNSVSAQDSIYAGVRVSPDGRFLCAVDIQDDITVANLTNGLPDDASLFGILNAPNITICRGMDWDAADNIYAVSSGQGLLRVFSLGLTTTCITSNDITGTNGTFRLVLPPVTATVVASTPIASQNYVNNASPGTPTPGVFTITLSTNFLAAPTVVTFFPYGTAVITTNYNINTGTDSNGVVITANNVTFPAGSYPPGGNWSVNVPVTPTATPVIGPTLSIGLRLIGGSSYLAGTPGFAVVGIQNTGPQLLFFTPASSGTTMSRNVPNDYAKFTITRCGDTNGPGNSAGSVVPKSYTVTNLTYGGTAVFPADYLAQAQRIDPAGNGVVQIPTAGSPGIVINAGDVTVTNVIGLPVRHTNLSTPPVNATITINPTNSVTGTNATSSEGYAYSVVPGGVTLTELDNTFGNEIVLWSDPLTNSLDSTNWTLTFAATNFAAFRVPPVVLPNYTNDETAHVSGGTNDFRVEFGVNTITNDNVPQSAAMVANGWTNALRMTVNKDGGNAPAGVNLFPQGVNFAGNYALRFSMYLSLYSGDVNNSAPGSPDPGWNFALFGVNSTGTNCNWRLNFGPPPSPGYNAPTNADGDWFAIDAAVASVSPADFDAFASPALPNAGVTGDLVSNNAQSQNGVFKAPPFAAEVPPGPTSGGEPINQWVDVSVEITLHTNLSVYINRSQVLSSFSTTNGGNYSQGKFMLGYLDPIPNVSDESAFVYYSNVRVVELAPYIYAQPTSLIVTQGASASFTSSTWLGTPIISNTWYFGTAPLLANTVQINSANATNITSILTLNNVQAGTNILVVASDPAGSESGAVASLEVILGPTNRTVNAGSNFVQFVVIPSGPSAPTAYQWKTNGVNLANSSHYAGVTSGTLTITNAQLSDAVTYSVVVSNPAGSVTPSATLTVIAPQPVFSGVSIAGTNALLSFTTTDLYDNTGSFTLQSSVNVQGPYVNTAGTITGSAGSFQFKVPLTTNSTMFYRLKHN